jgi:hypothetical protein
MEKILSDWLRAKGYLPAVDAPPGDGQTLAVPTIRLMEVGGRRKKSCSVSVRTIRSAEQQRERLDYCGFSAVVDSKLLAQVGPLTLNKVSP